MESQATALSNIDLDLQPARMMSGAEIVIEALLEHGIDVFFGYQGGTVIPFFDELAKNERIVLVTPAHEQGAVHAADGYARVSGKPAAVVVTSGPGAMNLATGLGTAESDGVPMIAITGQVTRGNLGTRAFQEADIVSMMKACTKDAFQVLDVNDLGSAIHRAYETAMTGRKGPVLIDVPSDLFTAECLYRPTAQTVCANHKAYENPATTNRKLQALGAEVMAEIKKAQKPIMLVGGGAAQVGSKTPKYVRELAEKWNCPVANTLMGRGVYPSSGDLWLGPTGMHGRPETNMALSEADLILVIGARLNDRITGARNSFAPNAKIVHIDIDPASVARVLAMRSNGKLPEAKGYVVDTESALKAILKAWDRESGSDRPDLSPWWERLNTLKREGGFSYEKTTDVIQPQEVLEILNEEIRGMDVIIATDVGQNQMWAHQFLDSEEPNRFITSGGQGTMGFGLPAANGIKIAKPNATVVVIAGDGGFAMTDHEMKTAWKNGLDIKVLVLNNQALGMVKQWQKVKQEGRFVATLNDSEDEDLVMLAQARRWTGLRCTDPSDIRNAIQQMLATPGPALLDCRVNPEAVVTPMTRPGHAPQNMITAKDFGIS